MGRVARVSKPKIVLLMTYLFILSWGLNSNLIEIIDCVYIIHLRLLINIYDIYLINIILVQLNSCQSRKL